MRRFDRSLLLAVVACLSLEAVPPIKPFPQLDATPAGATTSVTLGDVPYRHHGLVGAGMLPSDSLDRRGDTLGSFSSFKVDPATWRRLPDGTYAGTLYSLPDRGYNVAGVIDYPARLQKFAVTFRPDDLARPVAPEQLTLKLEETIVLRDARGELTSGLSPTGSLLGTQTPTPTAGGKLAVDTEGLALRPDGSFYVSEEYGPSIFHVSREGRILGQIASVPAFRPLFAPASGPEGFPAGKVTLAQTGGRRENQGLEAIDVTPDGRFLAAMLQSATLQDSPGGHEFNRAYTRLVIYDLAQGPTPARPSEHYLVELPVYCSHGLGGAPDKTAQQSEIIALSRTTFLVLTRDSQGNGSGKSAHAPKGVGFAENPMVYKNVALVSTVGATNLAGTAYEDTHAPAVTGPLVATAPMKLAPVAGLVAAPTTDFINLLNPNQLARFGLNLNVLGKSGATLAGRPDLALDARSLSEKWEALTLVSCLDPARPDDYFLMVGNDNDFITARGTMLGRPYDALNSTAGQETVDNPSRILVYRLTLPRIPSGPVSR